MRPPRKSRLSLLWDAGDYEAVSDLLHEELDPDTVESSTIDGMLSGGAHPKAIVNTIRAERGW